MDRTDMEYILVIWAQSSFEDPVVMYYEVNDQRETIRQVELYPDLTLGFASESHSYKSFITNEHPVPTIDNICSEPNLTAFQITQQQFENVWNKARASNT